MLIIPAIDLEGGRSRTVFWPGASAGAGVPTDRPDRIAARFVEDGAKVIHLVDFDGARAGAPVNLEAIGSVASRVAIPLQVAGGLEGGDNVRLAFAAGATRVVLCLAVAGDWLAIGLDPRPERLAAFPWRRSRVPDLRELVHELGDFGVRRFVVAHGGASPNLALLESLTAAHDADILVAGGTSDLAGIARLRDAGVSGLILGDALLSGAIDFPAALEVAA